MMQSRVLGCAGGSCQAPEAHRQGNGGAREGQEFADAHCAERRHEERLVADLRHKDERECRGVSALQQLCSFGRGGEGVR